jgi:AcrR family transcriptional regulator
MDITNKDLCMRASPPVFQETFSGPDYADLSKPAKERIALAARRLFMMYGIYMPLREIAELAESNEATAIKHYQCHGNLVQVYVQELIEENENHWAETAAEHPNDPEAQLRSWIEGIELRCGDAFEAVCSLPRAAAQLFRFGSPPLLTQVRAIRARELKRIDQLCRKAKFDEPSRLAHKLVLLVDGARSNSNSFGHDGPHSHLSEAAADLMAAHRGGAKLVSPLD